MNPSTPNHAESEFDHLLDQLTNELALTPMDQPGDAPDSAPEPRPRPDSVQAVAAPSAAARGLDPTVKIVGLLMGSVTIVAVAALLVFGGAEPTAVVTSGGVDDSRASAAEDEVAAAARVGRDMASRADQKARAAVRLAEREHVLRHEAQRMRGQAALAAEQAAKAKKKRKRRSRATKPKAVNTGSDFDLL